MHAVHTRPRPRARGGQACRRAAGWVRRGEGEGRHAHPAGGGGGGLSGAPCTSAEGGGVWPPPCAFSSGWRDVLHPCACQHKVEGLGLHPRVRQHRVKGTLGVAPLQPTPAPLPIEGLWECCNSCTPAAAHVPPLVHAANCCSCGSAAALWPTLASLTPRGHWGAAALKLQRTHGSSCSPCLAAIPALHPHRSQARSPRHHSTGRRDRVPSLVHQSTRHRDRVPPLCTTAWGGGTGSPTLCTIAQGGGTGSPPLCTSA